jgi:hypothetical protein
MSADKLNFTPSSIETIDAAFLEYVEGLNIFCTTINGWEKVPVIWSSAERAYQIKNNKEIRDKNGSLIPPIISLERVSSTKDPSKKGKFQAGLSPSQDRIFHYHELNQEKTSNFANADALKKKEVNFVTSKKNKKQVFTSYSIPIPIYITVEYKINIITNYQAQMNEAVQPFMARTAQNYFLIKKDGHKYECFMDQSFNQDSIASLGEEERKYKTVITVKVLGYLIGEGNNQEKPQILKQENAVELKIPKENLAIIQEQPAKQKEAPMLLRNFGTPISSGIAVKKTFTIGNGTDAVYQVTHNLSSRDLYVRVRENFGDFSVVEVSVAFSDLNNISIDMGDPIDSNSYVVTIIG